MKQYLTESGSVYEVDEEQSRVRRLMGTHDPTPRQGPDGQWKKYESMSISDGSLVFIWSVENDLTAKGTVTSRIVSEV